jgi:hypothetical protein
VLGPLDAVFSAAHSAAPDSRPLNPGLCDGRRADALYYVSTATTVGLTEQHLLPCACSIEASPAR